MRRITLRAAAAVVLAPTFCFGAAPGGPLPDHGGHTSAADTAKPASVGGFDRTNLDTSVKPCDDFYQFANGGWMTKNPIPAAYPSWGTFNELADRNLTSLRQILEELAKNPNAPKGSAEQKLGDFYATAMDVDKIEAEGLKPLADEFERIAAIKDLASLQAEIAHLHMSGVGALFGFGATIDAKNSTRVVAVVWQGGTTLPDRDYYLAEDDRMKGIREAYVDHLGKMFALLGDDAATAAANAKTVMAIETALATAQMPRVMLRNPDNTYHMMTRAEVKALASNIDFERYLKSVHADAVTDINVGQPDFVKAFDKLLGSTPIADLKTYVRWRLIDAAAPYLSSKFVDQNFAFKGKVLQGTQEILPRWKRAVNATDGNLGELLGEAYVKKYFTPAAKARMKELVGNLREALRDDLGKLPWMGEATRKQALAKLDSFVDKIGYPDKWRDYSELQVDRASYIGNIQRANVFDWHVDVRKIGKPVDKTEWVMTPPTVNAYYSPTRNEIVFPAGILQPPFFDANADDAYNYGGIGAVIGHEMTHGFDDTGSRFDAEGNLKNWWADEDLKNFKERAKCVSDQFTSYTVQGDLHLKGELVMGEAIADLGGLTLAYIAYQKSLEGKQRKEVDGFSSEQRFFLGWARVWAGNHRPEFERLMVNTNPHPLGRFRVNGTVANMPEFQKAWGCADDSKMVRAGRCQIW
jgi:putative endopeptidase